MLILTFISENIWVWFPLLLGYAVLFTVLTIFLLVRARRIAGFLAEKSLADVLSSRELFYALYRNSPVPYVLLLENGGISLPNESAVRLFGVTADELRGKIIFDFLGAEDDAQKTHMEIVPARFQQGTPIHNEECKLIRPDGAQHHILLSVFPVKASGNPHRGLAALVDITKQKEVERAKTEFVSLASHQLRSPLASLRWNVELLASPKSGTLSEIQQSYVATLERGIYRMGALIDDFLSMSRLELGMLTASKSHIVIYDFLSEVLKDFRAPIQKKRLIISTDVDTSTTSSDPALLHHIVANLVSNAIKYTPEGGQIRVRAYKHDGVTIFEVSDTGIGIPKSEQGRLFEKFFRASNAHVTASEGTGLGLYIVKLAVEALGGSLSFASRPGLGTAFTIHLPQ